VGFSTERLNRIDTAMQAEIDAGHYAGISVMVARHGKLVKSGFYGYQTLEGREPLREDAIYRIASMTKTSQSGDKQSPKEAFGDKSSPESAVCVFRPFASRDSFYKARY
jgi:hypothetical protein